MTDYHCNAMYLPAVQTNPAAALAIIVPEHKVGDDAIPALIRKDQTVQCTTDMHQLNPPDRFANTCHDAHVSKTEIFMMMCM